MKINKLLALGIVSGVLASAMSLTALADTYYYYDDDGNYYEYSDDNYDYSYDYTYDDTNYWYEFDDTYYSYAISSAYWDTDNDKAIARWSNSSSKTNYKVQLYRQTSSSYKKVGSVKSTSSTKYDFTSMIVNEGSGTYYFTVYPSKVGTGLSVSSGSLKVGSSSSSDITISDLKGSTSTTTTTSSSGPSSQVAIGWHRAADGVRWWYQETATTYAANKWLYINNLWYHFDAQGYMQTGWFQNTATDNQWYYLDPTNGNMVTNTIVDGRVINADGIWVH